MGRDRALPKSFAKIHERKQTPWFAVIFSFLAASLLLPLGKVETVGNLSSLAALLGFAAIGVALIRLRFVEPKLTRPYRVPFSIKKVPVPALLGVVSSLVLISQFSPTVLLIGLATLVLIALSYKVVSRH